VDRVVDGIELTAEWLASTPGMASVPGNEHAGVSGEPTTACSSCARALRGTERPGQASAFFSFGVRSTNSTIER